MIKMTNLESQNIDNGFSSLLRGERHNLQIWRQKTAEENQVFDLECSCPKLHFKQTLHIPSKDLSHICRIGAFLSFRTFYRLNNSPFFSLQIDTLIFLMPDRTASWEIEPNFHSIPSKTPLLRIFVNVICARPNTRYKLFGSWLFGYAYRGSLYCVGCCR